MTQGRFLPLSPTTNTTGYRFLAVADITDSIAKDFVMASDPRVEDWLDLVDGEVLSLAQERECPITAISIPLHKKINEYCRAYFCFVCFQDTFGRNDIAQSMQETIKLKLDWYAIRCDKLKVQCTKEMFMYTNIALTASQRAGNTISISRG
jgi:hypothetical protein